MEKTFPDGLLDWAGHRSGGVRRFFHDESGRPSGELIRTNLLGRIDNWAKEFVAGKTKIRCVILVGGPGNGKTEAIEECARTLDGLLFAQGRVINALADKFKAGTGQPVPRLASVSLEFSPTRSVQLSIVQDASVADQAYPGVSPSSLLLRDLETYATASSDVVYLACVNRGVLDEAFAASIDHNRVEARALLTTIISAVGLASNAPQAWPLEGYSQIAVWPMDMESLLGAKPHQESAGRQLLDLATDKVRWPLFTACAAGKYCPHCASREALSSSSVSDSLLTILRRYELASGKRWNFRDLGSLLSFVLAGSPNQLDDKSADPCARAARILESGSSRTASSRSAAAPFHLLELQYQHALFGKWPASIAKSLRKDIRELGLESERTMLGLIAFLNGQRRRLLPSTLEPLLENLCDLMDPALADPNHEIAVSSDRHIRFRDVDARFSQSIFEGLKFVEALDVLTAIEEKVIRDLGWVDQNLSTNAFRKPSTAFRVQQQIREFCCRIVRRTLGVRYGFTKDFNILTRFQRVVEGDLTLMHEVVKQVEMLLNEEEHFITSLNTTFGEPLPPLARRVILTTSKQKVRPQKYRDVGRPDPTLYFLLVGSGVSQQSIPLTYDLFKSVSELGEGMLVATMPRTVVALLDATRARLSGQIVRDEELLDGAEFRLGARNEAVGREFGSFVVRLEGQK